MKNNQLITLGLFLTVMIFSSTVFSNDMKTANNDSLKEVLIKEESGIQILSIRTTAAGSMLDFRYKVIDPKKAARWIDRSTKPLLHVLKNGQILQVPVTAKIGPLRQSAIAAKAGKNYFMFFGNPRRMVKSGDKVIIQIGDYKSKELTIE